MDRERLTQALCADQQAIAMTMVRNGLDPVTTTPLPMQQLRLLLLVCAGPPATSQELADRLGVSAATMTGLVDRLVNRGLLRRVPVPQDRRARIVQATAAGDALADEVTSFHHGHAREILDRLGDEELSALATGMAAVRRVVEATLASPAGRERSPGR